MLEISEFLKDNRVPDWVTKHPVMKDVKTVNKIFPSLGLHNFTINTDIKNDGVTLVIPGLISDMYSNMYYAKNNFYNKIYTWDGGKYAGSPEREARFGEAYTICEQFTKQLANSRAFVKQSQEKNGLYVLNDIKVGETIFAKKGEGLFKAYNKIRNLVEKHHNYAVASLESLRYFKEYSSTNFAGTMQMVFSADGMEGAWDILTMSQRGISSCQSWSGQYRYSAIGSMLDPFTGIIYLTSGAKTEHGTKMNRRCIVRFVVESATKLPCIFLEYMYPTHDATVYAAFKKEISKRISNKIRIIDYNAHNVRSYYIPYSDAAKALIKHSSDPKYINVSGSHNQYTILPYRDTFMEFKIKPDRDQVPAINQKLDTFREKLRKALTEKTKLSYRYINELINSINNHVINTVQMQDFASSKLYMRKIYMQYLTNKSKVASKINDNIQRLMKENGDKDICLPGISKKKKQATKTPKMDVNDILAQEVMPLVDQQFKNEWKTLISKSVAKRPIGKANSKGKKLPALSNELGQI